MSSKTKSITKTWPASTTFNYANLTQLKIKSKLTKLTWVCTFCTATSLSSIEKKPNREWKCTKQKSSRSLEKKSCRSKWKNRKRWSTRRPTNRGQNRETQTCLKQNLNSLRTWNWTQGSKLFFKWRKLVLIGRKKWNLTKLKCGEKTLKSWLKDYKSEKHLF